MGKSTGEITLSTKELAVVLLSGGLDSATALAMANEQGYDCCALSFRYGQRHTAELEAANRIAKAMQVTKHHVVDLDLSLFESSALTNHQIDIPTHVSDSIPVTYVPARNTIFLSIALGWAEVMNARAIFIGVNAVDYSGYPDCRPEYIQAFQEMSNLATKVGIEGSPINIQTPLIDLTKEEIIQQGIRLGVDYSITVSCYQASLEGAACGMCDSCRIRREGFEGAGVSDPTVYK